MYTYVRKLKLETTIIKYKIFRTKEDDVKKYTYNKKKKIAHSLKYIFSTGKFVGIFKILFVQQSRDVLRKVVRHYSHVSAKIIGG